VAAKPAQARGSSRATSGSGSSNSSGGGRKGSGGDGNSNSDLHAILANIQDIRHCKTYSRLGHQPTLLLSSSSSLSLLGGSTGEGLRMGIEIGAEIETEGAQTQQGQRGL